MGEQLEKGTGKYLRAVQEFEECYRLYANKSAPIIENILYAHLDLSPGMTVSQDDISDIYDRLPEKERELLEVLNNLLSDKLLRDGFENCLEIIGEEHENPLSIIEDDDNIMEIIESEEGAYLKADQKVYNLYIDSDDFSYVVDRVNLEDIGGLFLVENEY
jgi:tetrahydromethanopterin S-methyltransferase subunit G